MGGTKLINDIVMARDSLPDASWHMLIFYAHANVTG